MSALPSLDFEGVAAAALAACPGLLREWFPAGKPRGRKFFIGSVAGEAGDSLAVLLDSGGWHDAATGDRGGDLIALYAACHGVSQGEAVRAVAAQLGQDARPSIARAPAEVIPMPKRGPDWRALMPVPEDAPPPPTSHPRHGAPEHVAEVRGADGALLHLILRTPARDGGRKQVLPLTYGTLDGATGWHWKAPAEPRPLYGLPLTADAPVLVVEGEMKRDAAARLLPGWSVVSWPNGAQGIGRADWTVLAGRDVVVWPDADAPGREAAAAIVNVLRGTAGSVRAVIPPEGKADGWDLADAEREGWSGERVLEHISPPEEAPRDPEPDADDVPFRALGHDRGQYYFLPRGAGQVIALDARALHNAASLTQLAPRPWWEREFPGPKGQPFAIATAGNELIQTCHRLGVFDPDRQRGRGVWLDEGRTVLHLGDRLLCDGEEHPPARFRSRFVYEVARPLGVELGEPLPDREAAGLLRVCCNVSWENPDRDGRMLAGWVIAAAIGGALPWRPHLWIVAESGKGKSWVEDNILRPILGGLALRVQGKTTAPGILRALRNDGRAVLFDEAETQNRADQERMQQVIDLSRAASAENGADILKADTGKGGGVARYSIRSCFYFSAINLALSQKADESRSVVLTLRPSSDPAVAEAAFAALKAIHLDVMTADFGARLLARTLGLIPTIRHNVEVLASAIARGGVSRRTGDTLGVVLACAYSLTSTARMTPEQANAFLSARAWVGEAATDRETDPEWQRALTRLFQHEVRFTAGNGRPENATVGELVSTAQASGTDRVLQAKTAHAALRRKGIAIVKGDLRIHYGSELAKEAFAGTAWVTGWASTLARAPDAKANVNTYYGDFLNGKGVSLPLGDPPPPPDLPEDA